MATISLSNWDEKKPASVTDPGSTPTGIQKVVAVKVSFNQGSTTTGTGIGAQFTVDINSQDELVVTQSDESTTRPYEIASIDYTNDVAWLWVYGSWDRDGSNQIVVGCGTGDGTDYSSPRNATTTNGTGSNPWSQTGININFAYHLNEEASGTGNPDLYFDSSANAYNADDFVSATGQNGQFDNGQELDGSNDYIEPGTGPQYDSSQDMYVTGWINHSDLSGSNFQGCITQRDSGFSTQDWELYVPENGRDEGGSLKALIGESGGQSLQGTIGAIGTNEWFNVALSKNGDNYAIYLDGSQEDSATYSSGWTTSEPIQLGSWGSGSNVITGNLDEFRGYTESKSDAWRTAEQDMSPKGGQQFFSWGATENTVQTQPLTPVTQDGFEDGDYTNSPEWNRSLTDGNSTVQTGTVKTGTYSLEQSISVSGTESLKLDRGTESGITEGDVFHAWLNTTSFNDSVSSGGRYLLQEDSSGDYIGFLYGINNEGIDIRSFDGTLTETEVVPQGDLSNSTWYLLEIEFTDTTNNNLTARVFDNSESLVAEVTGISYPSSMNSGMDVITLSTESGGTSETTYWDDVSYKSQQLKITANYTESIILSDVYSRLSNYFRSENETFRLLDTLEESILIEAVEVVSLSDQTSTLKIRSVSLNETLKISASYSDNFGDLTGTVTKSGTGVENAEVFAVEKGTGEFLDYTTTDANGDFTIDSVKEGVYLVAADWEDPNNGEMFGDERSIDFNPS